MPLSSSEQNKNNYVLEEWCSRLPQSHAAAGCYDMWLLGYCSCHFNFSHISHLLHGSFLHDCLGVSYSIRTFVLLWFHRKSSFHAFSLAGYIRAKTSCWLQWAADKSTVQMRLFAYERRSEWHLYRSGTSSIHLIHTSSSPFLFSYPSIEKLTASPQTLPVALSAQCIWVQQLFWPIHASTCVLGKIGTVCLYLLNEVCVSAALLNHSTTSLAVLCSTFLAAQNCSIMFPSATWSSTRLLRCQTN